MSQRKDLETQVTPSLLDRLTDYEPKTSTEAPKSRTRSLAEMKQSVRRDLEWLLNSRSYPVDVDEDLEEISKSVVTFGLPDFTGISARSHTDLKRINLQLKEAIERFEPRLLDLKVVLEPVNNTDRELRFRVEAFLNVEPTPEPVVFDTVLELGSGDFEIKEI
ncbi:MAG: type VI secretion system baseplate subunit TssE [Acidobacteriota bacterium]|nr:MAG: type VI secretion system baseplate subunit TssE [Acidobacteriota bacterium]